MLIVYAAEFLANLSNNGEIDINGRPPVEIAFTVRRRWHNFSTSGREGDDLGVRDAWNGVVLWPELAQQVLDCDEEAIC